MNNSYHTTRDGQSIAPMSPFGATIVVYRRQTAGLEFLLLHRSHRGPGYEGDWAWTPPSGARYPGEAIEACARRELKEETGWELDLRPVPGGPADWRIYLAELAADATITLSVEHDSWQWASYEGAVALCKQQAVTDGIALAAEAIDRE